MALVDSEGFGFSATVANYVTYSIMSITSSGINASDIATGGPLGDNQLDIKANGTSSTGGYQRAVAFGSATVFVGTRINSPLFQVQLVDGTAQATLAIVSNSLGGGTVFRGSNFGTSIGTIPSGTFPISGWFYFELGATIASGTSGSVNIQVNGAPAYTLSGVNTEANGSTIVGGVQFIDGSGVQSSFAHQYFCDNTGASPWNTFLGDVRVQSVFPTANDAVAFTPNGLSANYSNAAKVPPVPGTDYNSDSTVGDQDTFTCATISSALTNVFGLNVKALALKSDSGGRSLQTALKSSSAVGLGTSTALSTSAKIIKTVYTLDPNTSAAWTLTNANASKPGYKISA